MSDRHEDADARLARLRDATDPVRPRPDFAARVAATIDRERESAKADWLTDLFLPARRLLPVAALAAAAAVLLATQSASVRRSPGVAVAASATELDTEW
jgi:hypothetical protein